MCLVGVICVVLGRGGGGKSVFVCFFLDKKPPNLISTVRTRGLPFQQPEKNWIQEQG